MTACRLAARVAARRLSAMTRMAALKAAPHRALVLASANPFCSACRLRTRSPRRVSLPSPVRS